MVLTQTDNASNVLKFQLIIYANVGSSALAPPNVRLVSQHFTKALSM